MEEKLTIKTENIKEGDPAYCWVNIELGGSRVGRVRLKKLYRKVIIKNINIFPEFEGRGFATQIINLFKETAREIIADRVRDKARDFWEKMGFEDTSDGNYRWRRDGKIGRTGTISYFFRDQKGLERALDSISWSANPKIWSAGCSSGQEPFTIAILLAERMSAWKFKNLTIIATDIVEEFQERIREGIYIETEVNAVKTNRENEPLFNKYFSISDDGRYEVIAGIRRKVTFILHNILTDKPISDSFDMICCKNVFEYFNLEEKQRVYLKFYQALKPDGVLLIDPKQRNKEFEAPEDLFSRICKDCVERVYRKR